MLVKRKTLTTYQKSTFTLGLLHVHSRKVLHFLERQRHEVIALIKSCAVSKICCISVVLAAGFNNLEQKTIIFSFKSLLYNFTNRKNVNNV